MLKAVTSVTLIAALGLTGCSTASGTTLTSGTSTVHSAVSGATAGTSTSNTAAEQTLDAQTHYTNEDLTWAPPMRKLLTWRTPPPPMGSVSRTAPSPLPPAAPTGSPVSTAAK